MIILLLGSCDLDNEVKSYSPRELLGSDYVAPTYESNDLDGSVPDEWEVTDWIHSEPLTLRSLRGNVILVRWWTAPNCPYCQASADALNEFWKKYRNQGLVVIGFYHHKSDAPFTHEHVRRYAERLGFMFPIAVDKDWKTLNYWWLKKDSKRWTSVSFLLDHEEKVSHIHPGGAFFQGEPSYFLLKQKIEDALERRNKKSETK